MFHVDNLKLKKNTDIIGILNENTQKSEFSLSSKYANGCLQWY